MYFLYIYTPHLGGRFYLSVSLPEESDRPLKHAGEALQESSADFNINIIINNRTWVEAGLSTTSQQRLEHCEQLVALGG
jgi:hypothetical protein